MNEKVVPLGHVIASDLRRGERIEIKVDTPDGPMTIYPKVIRVLMHPSNMDRVHVDCYEPPYSMLPAIRCTREFRADDVIKKVKA